MRSQRGVTLISITIYVIGMVIIVALITVMTNYFYKNVDYTNYNLQWDKQYTTISMFFTEESNLSNNKILEINESINANRKKQKWVAFNSKNQYTYVEENHSLYRNNVKIAQDIYGFEVLPIFNNGKQGFKIKIINYEDMSYYFKN